MSSTECEEVAVNMNPLRRLTFDEALRLVRGDMLDESETVISTSLKLSPPSAAVKFPTLHEISQEIMTILGRSTHLVDDRTGGPALPDGSSPADCARRETSRPRRHPPISRRPLSSS